jgi:hypothetical protein
MSCVIIAVVAGFARAQSPPSLDELLNIAPAEAQPAPADPPAAKLDEQVVQALDVEQAADVFQQLLTEMQQVSQRLGSDLDPGIDTQRLQEQILVKLEQVMASARRQQQQQQQSSSSSSSSQSQQQQSESNKGSHANERGRSEADNQAANAQAQQANNQGENRGDPSDPGKPREGDAIGAMESNRAEWGNLPPRLRDELMQGIDERFSPVYQEMTESYYRKLAEEAP